MSSPEGIPIEDLYSKKGKEVVTRGWIHHFRKMGKAIFIVLRESGNYIQCIAKPQNMDEENYHIAAKLTRETVVHIRGEVKEDKRAPYGGVELVIKEVKVVCGIAPTELEEEIRPDSGPEVLLDKRHLTLRGMKTGRIMQLKSIAANSLRSFFLSRDFYEMFPPTLVQTQVEGGSTLFHLKYFGQDAYLTQSSQLYLETVIPALSNVFCIMPSYRAEKSVTRRHLTEYIHLEAEMAFFGFNDLLELLEDMMITLSKDCIKIDFVKEENPDFSVPKKPFRRVTYAEAIGLLQSHGIKDKVGNEFIHGTEITMRAEMDLLDIVDEPIFLTEFPLGHKPFYMKINQNNPEVTNSADLLLPGIGEIIGASQREDNYDILMQKINEEGLDPTPYYWYTDLRKYGSVPHSGFGLGLERTLQWILNLYHIRDACLYPRRPNRITP